MKNILKYLFVFGFASLTLIGCVTKQSKLTQWEYRIERLQDIVATGKLNEFGKDGWMLVTIVHPSGGIADYLSDYTLKRPKR